METNYAYFTDLDGKEVRIGMVQVVDDEFAEIVADHPTVIGIPVYFNSKGNVWPRPSDGVKTRIVEIWNN